MIFYTNDMKHTLRLLTLILITACSLTATAQPAESEKRDQQVNPNEFAQVQAQHIADELKLDENTTRQFVNIYRECAMEVWALGRPGGNKKATTDAEAEAAIQRRFEHSQKMLDIRKKYYNEYRRILTPLQIERVYQIEEQMMRKLQNRRPHNNHGSRP